MTKDKLDGVKTLLPFLAIKHIDPQPFADVIVALEQAWQERDSWRRTAERVTSQRDEAIARWTRMEEERDALKAELQTYRDAGITEELLRNGDGYIKVGQGCLIISAHYLEEKDVEIAALKKENNRLNKAWCALMARVSELTELCRIGDIEKAALQAKVEELEKTLEMRRVDPYSREERWAR